MKPSSYNLPIIKAGTKRYASLVIIGLLAINITPAKANGGVLETSRINQYVFQANTSLLQGNVSIIEQIGNSNTAQVSQSRSASYQSANFSKIYQDGNNNQASITQNNGNNISVITQKGNGLTANITQHGNGRPFKADIDQSGFSGDVTISQSGSGLSGVSVQQQNYSGNARPVTIDTY